MTNDELADIRSIRRQISRECNGQSEEVFDYYEDEQKRLKATGKFTFVNKRMDAANTGHSSERSDTAEP